MTTEEKKPMVFETDLFLETTEDGDCLTIDMNGIQILIPVEKVKKILAGEIEGASISISTSKTKHFQNVFVTSTEKQTKTAPVNH